MRLYKITEFIEVKVEPVDISTLVLSSIELILRYGYTYDNDFQIIFDLDNDKPSEFLNVNEARVMLKTKLRDDKLNSLLSDPRETSNANVKSVLTGNK
jgi:hypothetical protein